MDIKARLFYHTFIQKFLSIFGLGKKIPIYYQHIKEFNADTKEIKLLESTCTFSRNSLIDKAYLKEELPVISDLLKNIKDDDVFYDIGADAGLYTCFVKESLRGEGNVVAFEPHPTRQISLVKNLQRNDLSAMTIDLALADSKREGILEYGIQPEKADSKRGWKVKIDEGDSVISQKGLPQPNVMKIDVEGAELSVLRGLKSAISSEDCRLLYIETHPEKLERFDGSIDELCTLLRDAGFSISTVNKRGSQEFLKAEK